MDFISLQKKFSSMFYPERREREEDEGTAEEGKDPAATAFINRDEGTGFKVKARVKSRKSGLSPDISNVESKEDDMRGHAGIRTSRDTSPEESVSNMRSPAAIKYHGLENQGSTCYLSSVLQVLFMTKDFREAVERLPSEKTEHIDLQLQSLFGDLKRRTAKTKDITKKLRIRDVCKQQDAAEYYEKILHLTSDDASKIFHGQLTHMTRCSSCGNKTGADRAFWHLPLALEGSYSQNFSVEKGIEEFFRASHFNGENQMYCDECRARSDATTKCVIKHHPEVLTLLLKRFEFDHYSNRCVKVNCAVDVPCTLQIPESQTYELYAMVEHSGDLRSGHYSAKIKSEHDGRWYSFNDSWVTELHSQPFQSDKVEKSSSAYLLFYRKEKVSAAGTQDFRVASTPGGSPLSTCETQDQSPAERRERQREEDEGTAEEGKDPAATAFINRGEGTGIKETDRVKSRKSGLSPDISNVESNEDDMRGHAGIRTSRDTSPKEGVSNMWSRPAIKYHGLENQGSTCYLNSVLQVLFMTKDFREAVERFPSEKTEHIDLQLQSLFGVLKSRTAKTKDITKKLGIQDVYKQQDAAEYYEKILHLTSDDASKIFHGQLTHMTTCSSCGNKTGADRAFWHLPLALEDSYSLNFSVEKGIEEFFRASHFNGRNQMYCNKCRAKSDATTKCVIKHHPEVLTLLLKRFEFDHYSNRYVKINCTVDVPCTLQIPENQTYELYAMVEHSGDLRSGHHIAKIKSEDDGRWYSFNDRWVTELHSQPFQSDKVEKSSRAYLLFYRKEKVPAGTQVFREESTPGGSPLSTCETQDQSEKRKRKNLSMDTEHHGHEGLGNVKHDNLEGQQKMQQAHGPGVEQQGDGLRTEKDVEVDKEGKTDPSPLIEDRRVDGRKQNMSEDLQGFEARRIREDRRDVEGAKEQKRGDDKHAQRTKTSMTKPYLWEGGEDQDRRGLDGDRQDRQQQKTSVPQDPKDVDEERPAKEQERKPFPNRGGSSRKQLIVKEVEEETKETPFGSERSIETKIIGIKTREKPAQQERLSECFSDMKLSEPQKQGTKRHTGNSYKGNVPSSAIDSNAENKPRVSDTQEQAAESQPFIEERGEGEIKSRGHHAQQEKNRKGKKKKTTFIIKPWKQADQTSEWYSFNDSCVRELHSQPFQLDKVEKSSSASLLFYRKEKVPAAGTQDFREESTPGGSPLSTCETQDQSEKRKRVREEEDEGTAEEGRDPAATAFINRSEGTGIKETDRVKSRKSGLSPDISNVESKEEDMRGHAGIRTSRDTTPEESVSNMGFKDKAKVKLDPSPLIEDRRVDGRKQNMSEDLQGFEARSRREDRRDVEGAKEQKRGDDKHAQRTDTSMTEDQDRRGLDGVRQQKTSVPQDPKDVDEERPAKEQERKPFPNRGGSSRKQFIVKTDEEETKETPFGTQRSIETKIIGIKTREKPAQQERLSECFSDMKLSEPQKQGTKRHKDNQPQLRKEDGQYELNSHPTGLCLIINNEHFWDGKVRRGTDKDAESLAEVFSWLGFRVLMCKDQTKDQMVRALECFASQCNLSLLQEFNVKEWTRSRFTDLLVARPQHGDAFICCVLSHGNKGSVLGIDGQPLRIKQITRTFMATCQSPLTDKPKVFLIQACQGGQIHPGVLLNDLEADGSQSTSIPQGADVFVQYATVEDHIAIRSPTEGSWFIQSVCKQLKEGCQRNEEIEVILRRVNNEVAGKEGGVMPGAVKQMPEIRHTLRKGLVLTPHRN